MMSINRPIAFAQSCNLATPTLFGFVRPQLIMPQTILNSLNDDQLQHVFLHELAHGKRNDIGINWFMHVLLIIHWFNPVLWYAYRRMREDQEIASDALALSCLTPDKSQDYGYTLIKLLENFSQPVQVAGNVNLTGSKAQLQRRIKMIKQFKSNSYRWSFLGLATLIFISGCALTNPKSNQTATQLPSETVSEVKPTDSVVPQPTASDKPTDSVRPQPTASDDKSAASVRPQPTASDDKQAASVRPQPTASDDKQAASVGPQPTASDDKPRAAASVEPKTEPSVGVQPPRTAPSVVPQQSRPAPSVSQRPRPAPSVVPQQPRPAASVAPQPTASTAN
jgi:bla regulator protein BlaR1